MIATRCVLAAAAKVDVASESESSTCLILKCLQAVSASESAFASSRISQTTDMCPLRFVLFILSLVVALLVALYSFAQVTTVIARHADTPTQPAKSSPLPKKVKAHNARTSTES